MQVVVLKMTSYLSASCHEHLNQGQLLRLGDLNIFLKVSKTTIEILK